MPWQELIPPELMDKERAAEVLTLIVRLPIDIWTKKHMYVEWAKAVGYTVRVSDIEYLTLGTSYLTRG